MMRITNMNSVVVATLLLRHQRRQQQQYQTLLLTTNTTRRRTTPARRPNHNIQKHPPNPSNFKYTGGMIVGVWATICGIGSAIIMARD